MHNQHQPNRSADDRATGDIEATIAQAWHAQLAQAAHRPALATTLLHQSRDLYDRFVIAYRNLLALSRQRRRKLLRNLGTSLAGAALALALSNAPGVYAIPNPSGGNASLNGGVACDLKDAIVAANTDTATGLCAAGLSGADTITLTGNVTLTSAYNSSANGLPVITSAITIQGAGFTIARSSVSNFRILAVDAGGNLTLNNTTITGGSPSSGSNGGGIINQGTLTLNNSTVSGNSTGSNNSGGGIYSSVGSALTLTNSTVSGNSARWGGGLIGFGALTLSNSTVSVNTASDNGGGIYNGGTLTLNRSLVSGNTASSAQEIYNPAPCLNAAAVSAPTCLANVNDVIADAFNLIGHSGETNAQAFYGFTPSASDITATSDGTKPTALAGILNTTLANNGSATKTHALVVGSPAIDAAGDGPLATDQRGVARPQGAADDIGSFEVKTINNTVIQTSVTAGTYNPTLVSCGASSLATQTVTPLLHNNNMTTAFSGLFFKVKILDYKVAQTGGVQPLLCNADTQGGGVGATFTVAGTLAANSNLTPSPAFVIGLPVRAAYRFFVDLYSTSATVANTDSAIPGDYLGSFEYEFDENGQLVGGQNSQFLPLIIH